MGDKTGIQWTPDGSMPKGPGRALGGYDTRWPLPNVWMGVSCENQETADERIPHLIATPAAVRFVSAEPLLGPIDLTPYLGGLTWVICGGESGPGARDCQLSWIRRIVNDCNDAGTAVHVKQLGARAVDDLSFVKLKHHKGGDMSEWPADVQVRQFPEVAR